MFWLNTPQRNTRFRWNDAFQSYLMIDYEIVCQAPKTIIKDQKVFGYGTGMRSRLLMFHSKACKTAMRVR